MNKKMLSMLLLLAPLIFLTTKMAFSIDPILPDHPPKTIEEREAIEKLAMEIALSDRRVKALISERGDNYNLQSTAVMRFHAEFISKELIGTDARGTPIYKETYHYVWDGKLRGTVVFLYNDSSIYFVHVDVTDRKVWYIGYIRWDRLDPVTHTPSSNEPLECINIFYDGRAQNLIDKNVSQDTIRDL